MWTMVTFTDDGKLVLTFCFRGKISDTLVP